MLMGSTASSVTPSTNNNNNTTLIDENINFHQTEESGLKTMSSNDNTTVADKRISDDEHCEFTNEKATSEWYDVLKEGDLVDATCNVTSNWIPAKVVAIDESSVKVHYQGWKKTFDITLSRDDIPFKLAPANTKCQHRQKKKKTSSGTVATATTSATVAVKAEAPSEWVSNGLMTKGGRKIFVKALPATTTASTPGKETKMEQKEQLVLEDDPLCEECWRVEDDDLTLLLLCDGPCGRGFHMGCLGYTSVPESAKWYCQDCQNSEYECFICNTPGTYVPPVADKNPESVAVADKNSESSTKSSSDSTAVLQCSVNGCYKFYHLSCIKAHPNATLRDNNEFICPIHKCDVCKSSLKMNSIEYLSCLRCPRSYHTSRCIPPSTRFNIYALLCKDHPEVCLPVVPSKFDPEERFDTTSSSNSVRWDLLPIKSESKDFFSLPIEFLSQCASKKPPAFKRIHRNDYSLVKSLKQSCEDAPVCQCETSCDDNCYNVISYYECVAAASVSSKGGGNCPIGPSCGNRRLQQRSYAAVKAVAYKEKGWGLRLEKSVAEAGSLIIEYIGEILTESMMEDRMLSHKKQFPNDNNMYIMDLGRNLYIDARLKSNLSRFINHSCEPNCRILKWVVGKKSCIGVYSLRPIEAGEELTYDYQFLTSDASNFKCACGAETCRGTLAPVALKKK